MEAGIIPNVTIRSYVWKETAYETDFTICRIQLEFTFHKSTGKALICPRWYFDHAVCGLQAAVGRVNRFNADWFTDVKRYTCLSGASTVGMNGSIEVNSAYGVRFYSERVRSRSPLDREYALFFETSVSIKRGDGQSELCLLFD